MSNATVIKNIAQILFKRDFVYFTPSVESWSHYEDAYMRKAEDLVNDMEDLGYVIFWRDRK